MSVIQTTIKDYLEAIERTQGAEVRRHTTIEDRGAGNIFLKRANDDTGNVYDISDIQSMTRHLRAHG